ncbi:hypothetical protein B0H14DRAFT_2621815 [Mycena olivaceomarginata]|nr:hypothetical protein B0H14DRAFT_2621815 [Mycena olivaceomarginata]
MNRTDAVVGIAGHPGATIAKIAAFDMFAFLGLFWLAAVLLTAAVSPAIHRSKAWFAHLGAWAAFSLSYVLIIGRQTESASRACVSWLMYGLRHSRFSAPLTEVYLKIYLGISAMLFEKQIHPGWSIFLAAFPYMFATCVFIRVLLVFSQFSTQNSTDQQHSLLKIQPLFNAIPATFTVTLRTQSTHEYVRSSSSFPEDVYYVSKSVRNLSKSQTDSRYGLPIFVRFGAFTILYCFGAGIGGFTVAVGKATFNSWSVMLPTGSILAALVFGTQMDILKLWMFWRKNPTGDDVSSLEFHCQGCDCFVPPVWYERHVYPTRVSFTQEDAGNGSCEQTRWDSTSGTVVTVLRLTAAGVISHIENRNSQSEQWDLADVAQETKFMVNPKIVFQNERSISPASHVDTFGSESIRRDPLRGGPRSEYTTRTVKTRSSRQNTSLEGAETSTSKIDWKRQTFEIAGSTRKIAQIRTKRAAFSSSRYWTWLDQEEYRVKYEAEMDRTWTVYSYDGTILATFTAYTRRFLRDNSMPVLSVSEEYHRRGTSNKTKRLESLREVRAHHFFEDDPVSRSLSSDLSPYVFVILDLFLVPNIRPDIRTELAAGIIGTTMFSHLGQFYVAARRRFSMAIYTSA